LDWTTDPRVTRQASTQPRRPLTFGTIVQPPAV
jgi:hypothetical protein